MVPGLLFGAAFALLGLGAVWGWQAWSGRVSVPIDDRLPLLVSSVEADVDAPGDAAEPVPIARADALATAVPEDPVDQVQLDATEPHDVVVHVAGAVVRPGVVTLEPGARVVDAIDRAGGPGAQADLDRVNLAAVVIDGERIHVPAHGEDEPPTVVAPSRAGATLTTNDIDSPGTPELMLDINVATAESLEALPGIGPSIAQAIVQTRTNRGPFLLVEELLDVPGIGDAKLAQIEAHVRVGR